MGKVFASVCQEAGLESFIIFPQAGPKTLEAFVVAARETDLTPIVGLVMTHPGYLESEGGFISNNAPDMILDISLKLGVRSFVLPGTKIDIINKYASEVFSMVGSASILMPGIGTQGGDIASAFQAAKGHHTFAIVGSAIYNSPDPERALEKLSLEVRRCQT
jgi:orotidine-5'-phosphate decarboxylase